MPCAVCLQHNREMHTVAAAGAVHNRIPTARHAHVLLGLCLTLSSVAWPFCRRQAQCPRKGAGQVPAGVHSQPGPHIHQGWPAVQHTLGPVPCRGEQEGLVCWHQPQQHKPQWCAAAALPSLQWASPCPVVPLPLQQWSWSWASYERVCTLACYAGALQTPCITPKHCPPHVMKPPPTHACVPACCACLQFVEELSKLQDRVPAFSADKAAAIVEADLGQPVSVLFRSFDPRPIAAASLGQVRFRWLTEQVVD